MSDRVHESGQQLTDRSGSGSGTGPGAPDTSLRDLLPVQNHIDPARAREERDFVNVAELRQAFDAKAGDGPSFNDLVDDKLQLRLEGAEQATLLTDAVRANDDRRICGALAAEAQLQLKITRADSQMETVMRRNASSEGEPHREVSLLDSADSDADAPDPVGPLLPDLTNHQASQALQHLAKVYQVAKERAGTRAGTSVEPTAETVAAEVAGAYQQIAQGKEQFVDPGRETAWDLVADLLAEQTTHPPTGLGERIRPLLNRLQDGLDEEYRRRSGESR
jgi:hypothetical protein